MNLFKLTPEMYAEFDELRKTKPTHTLWTVNMLYYNIVDHPDICPTLGQCKSVKRAARHLLKSLTPPDNILLSKHSYHTYYVLGAVCQ